VNNLYTVGLLTNRPLIRSLMFCNIIDVQKRPSHIATIRQCHISYFVLLHKFIIPINTSYRFILPGSPNVTNFKNDIDDGIMDRMYSLPLQHFILLFVITKRNRRNSITAILGIYDVTNTIPFFCSLDLLQSDTLYRRYKRQKERGKNEH